jgi:hypothetical protein
VRGNHRSIELRPALTDRPPGFGATPPSASQAREPDSPTGRSADGCRGRCPRDASLSCFAADRPAPFRYASCFARGPADTSRVRARHSVARPCAGVRDSVAHPCGNHHAPNV